MRNPNSDKGKKNVYAGTGVNTDDDPYKAGKEAVEAAIEKAGVSPDFGFIFCSGGKYGQSEHDMKKLVQGVNDALEQVNKNCNWVGCTTGGEIYGDGVNRESVVALMVKSDFIRSSIGVGEDVSRDPKKAGKKAADMALEHLKLDQYVDSYIRFESTKKKTSKELANMKQFTMIALSPGFTFKKAGWEEEIVKGMQEVAGIETPIVGGSAADDSKFIKNYQFANGKLYEDAVINMAIFSNLKFGLGLAHGYEKTSKIVLVTKSQGNTAYELNGKPAVDVYAEVMGISKEKFTKGLNFLQTMGKIMPDFIIRLSQKFGKTPEDMAKDIPFYLSILENPLSVPDVNGDCWLKVPKGITKEGGLEFYNPVYQGYPLLLMKVNQQKYLNSASESLKNSLESFKKKKPAFSIVFECLGRYIYLKDTNQLDESFVKMKKVIGTDNVVGFYTACEIGASKNLPSANHTYTCSSISFSDELIT